MLHIDVAKTDMIQQEILLGTGKVLVLSSEHTKIENFGEVGTGTIGASTVVFTHLLCWANAGDEVRNRVVR